MVAPWQHAISGCRTCRRTRCLPAPRAWTTCSTYSPSQNVLQQVLAGSGECAEMDWSFLGLSLPAWSMVVFAGLLIVALIQMFRPLPR